MDINKRAEQLAPKSYWERILVTGGSGFIGSNLVFKLLGWGYQVLNYDALTYAANPNNLKDIEIFEDAYHFVHGDITDEKTFESACKDFSPAFIINMAAESHVDNSILNPQQFLKTNILGADVVLRVAKNLDIPVLQMSTDEVYGSLVNREADEFFPFEPNSPYSVSKAACDMLALAYKTTYKAKVVVARGSNAYGPRQHPEKFIPKAITNLLQNKPIPLYGNGQNIREWTYVEDFCDGLVTIMRRGEFGQAYNIGHGYENRISNLEIAKKLVKLMGRDDSFIQSVTDRPGHDLGYALNSSKLRKMGWTTAYDLSEGLHRTIDWYQRDFNVWEAGK